MKVTVNDHPTYIYTGAREFVPEQPSIVFIHGNGLDHSVWLLQSRYFSHHGRNVLAVDMPGHGRSGGAPLENITDMADWMVDMLDATGVDKAMVVGHSMGSLVAMETAARHPERVSKLVLIATASPMPVSDPLLNAARENRHDAFDMINLWGHSQYGQMGGNQAPGMWMSGSAIRLLERSGPGVLFAGLNACNEYRHGMESAAKVQCPTLMVLGRLDVMTPARVARKLEQVIPEVRSVVLDNCGHLIMAEKPNQVLDLLLDFLE
jgi:pimeloyl-ACP methyl ester carboxylesterase